MTIRYGSVCSGIESASVAWEPLGFVAAWFAEIEPFPSAVLAHRWPNIPNLGDMTTIADRVRTGEVEAPDVLVGGTPCQAFSVAGLRKSLADARGNLTYSFVELADAIDSVRLAAGKPPAFILWENVPGVFSVADNAFGCFLGGLVGSNAPIVPAGGGGWTDAGVADGPARRAAWRILDAQHLGLAQRRERVFVLARGGAGDWSAADALLPVIESVRWHPPPSRATRQGVAGPLGAGAKGRGWSDDLERSGAFAPEVASTVQQTSFKSDRGSAIDLVPEVSPTVSAKWSKGTGGPSGDEAQNLIPVPQLVPFDETQITHPENRSRPKNGDPSPTLAKSARPPAVAFSITPESGAAAGCGAVEVEVEVANALTRVSESSKNQRGTHVVEAKYASTQKTDSDEILRTVRREVGAQAPAEWGSGIPDSLWAAEVLRREVHGGSVRCAPGEGRAKLGDRSPPRPEDLSEGPMRPLRKAKGRGASQERKLAGQRTVQPRAIVPVVPQHGAQATWGVQDLWSADKGPSTLRPALPALGEARGSADDANAAAPSRWVVRRLTPKEAERLQGFPDGHTSIPFKGKPAADSPRYRALGNSMAVNVMRYLGQRISEVFAGSP